MTCETGSTKGFKIGSVVIPIHEEIMRDDDTFQDNIADKELRDLLEQDFPLSKADALDDQDKAGLQEDVDKLGFGSLQCCGASQPKFEMDREVAIHKLPDKPENCTAVANPADGCIASVDSTGTDLTGVDLKSAGPSGSPRSLAAERELLQEDSGLWEGKVSVYSVFDESEYGVVDSKEKDEVKYKKVENDIEARGLGWNMQDLDTGFAMVKDKVCSPESYCFEKTGIQRTDGAAISPIDVHPKERCSNSLLSIGKMSPPTTRTDRMGAIDHGLDALDLATPITHKDFSLGRTHCSEDESLQSKMSNMKDIEKVFAKDDITIGIGKMSDGQFGRKTSGSEEHIEEDMSSFHQRDEYKFDLLEERMRSQSMMMQEPMARLVEPDDLLNRDAVQEKVDFLWEPTREMAEALICSPAEDDGVEYAELAQCRNINVRDSALETQASEASDNSWVGFVAQDAEYINRFIEDVMDMFLRENPQVVRPYGSCVPIKCFTDLQSTKPDCIKEQMVFDRCIFEAINDAVADVYRRCNRIEDPVGNSNDLLMLPLPTKHQWINDIKRVVLRAAEQPTEVDVVDVLIDQDACFLHKKLLDLEDELVELTSKLTDSC